MFRFLYVTDLHGWTNGYEEILQIALQEAIDTIVNGGDIWIKKDRPPSRLVVGCIRTYWSLLDGFISNIGK